MCAIAGPDGFGEWFSPDGRVALGHRRLAIIDLTDGVNTWFVSQAAAAQGIKVALSGLGGDELFASYPSFADLPRMRNLERPACITDKATLGATIV